eukprot:375842-Prymnesium_polylepis.1
MGRTDCNRRVIVPRRPVNRSLGASEEVRGCLGHALGARQCPRPIVSAQRSVPRRTTALSRSRP